MSRPITTRITPLPGEAPYFDWWRKTDAGAGTPKDGAPLLSLMPHAALGPDGGLDGSPRLTLDASLSAPAEPGVWNSGFDAHLAATGDWLPPPERLPIVPDDTVIVGVIDADIPLGHRRLCDADGNSRVLAAWQMGDQGTPAYLPFGNELYRDDIDRHLVACRTGPSGRLDEMAFNQACGLVDMTRRYGRRALAGRHSHGAHILDVAAGSTPTATGDPIARAGIIAVNLPHRVDFGASGEFLEYFMIQALRRVVDLGDAIWLRNHPDRTEGPIGYPTVINISFGRQAGRKQSPGRLAEAISQINAFRAQRHAPLDVVMPAGNDNLERVYAVAQLKRSGARKTKDAVIDWRLQPEDQSSNYVEVWFKAPFTEESAADLPIDIILEPPSSALPPVSAKLSQVCEIPGVAAIYSSAIHDDVNAGTRLYRVLLCVAPTSRPGATGPLAPSGAWKIRLRNSTDYPVRATLNIQTDQSVLPSAASARRSYFEELHYRRHDAAGRSVDSATAELEEEDAKAARGHYPGKTFHKPKQQRRKFSKGANPCIRRHGTLNATASSNVVVCVGGYRASDGLDAAYSSTGKGEGTSPGGRGAPTASLPTDDGAAHPGRLAAGSADGSVAPLRGTSFAAAQATRFIAEARLAGDVETSGKQLVASVAASDEPVLHLPRGRVIAQSGSGRMCSPFPERVKRLNPA